MCMPKDLVKIEKGCVVLLVIIIIIISTIIVNFCHVVIRIYNYLTGMKKHSSTFVNIYI